MALRSPATSQQAPHAGVKSSRYRSTGRQHRLEDSGQVRRTRRRRRTAGLHSPRKPILHHGIARGARQAPIPTLQAERDAARTCHVEAVCVRPPLYGPYSPWWRTSPYQAGETQNVCTASDLKEKEREGKTNEASLLQEKLDNRARLLQRPTPSCLPDGRIRRNQSQTSTVAPAG